MIEEPYRWVEAIANRGEYIETQLAASSPIAAVGYRDGILFLTLGRNREEKGASFQLLRNAAIAAPIERVEHDRVHLPIVKDDGRCQIER